METGQQPHQPNPTLTKKHFILHSANLARISTRPHIQPRIQFQPHQQTYSGGNRTLHACKTR